MPPDRRQKDCKGKGTERSARIYSLLDMTWLCHSWTHSGYGYLHKIESAKVLVRAHSLTRSYGHIELFKEEKILFLRVWPGMSPMLQCMATYSCKYEQQSLNLVTQQFLHCSSPIEFPLPFRSPSFLQALIPQCSLLALSAENSLLPFVSGQCILNLISGFPLKHQKIITLSIIRFQLEPLCTLYWGGKHSSWYCSIKKNYVIINHLMKNFRLQNSFQFGCSGQLKGWL